MKKQIFDYIKLHPDCTHHQVSAALNISEMQVLAAMHEMVESEFLRIKVRALGNTVDPNCSAFYYAIKDFYPQENEQLEK